MAKYDGSVMRSRDTYTEEQYQEERYYTQNSYSDDELESVKRRLETVFPKRNWSNAEIALLRRQMPIPEWEMKLVLRFYHLPRSQSQFLRANKLDEHEFLLVRRRHTMKTLLEYWGDEVGRALFFFKTAEGDAVARRHGWDLNEMRWNGEA